MSGLRYKPCQNCCIHPFGMYNSWYKKSFHTSPDCNDTAYIQYSKAKQTIKRSTAYETSHDIAKDKSPVRRFGQELLVRLWSVLMTGLTKTNLWFLCWRLTHSHPVHESSTQNKSVFSTSHHFYFRLVRLQYSQPKQFPYFSTHPWASSQGTSCLVTRKDSPHQVRCQDY